MPSRNYELFAKAMAERKQVHCTFDGHSRVLCPVLLGHRGDQEVALAYQIGGNSSKGLPPGGAWRCITLARVRNASLRPGAWRSGSSHTQLQSWVEVVDLDVNPASPYTPKRRL